MKRRERVKALVVDDTAFIRRALVEILSKDEAIDVVGEARHGLEALDAIDLLDPDVVAMDVDMPVMDGLTAIKHIMVRHPRPVVMISGLSDQGVVTLEALRLGAVDFFPKPSGTISSDMNEQAGQLQQVIRRAAQVNSTAIRRVRLVHERTPQRPEASLVLGAVIVGAHQGCSGSLIRLLANVSPGLPLVMLAVQELSPEVLESYSRELAQLVPWRLRVAVDGPFEKGCCYLATCERPWHLQVDGSLVQVMHSTGGIGAMDRLLEQAAGIMGRRTLGVLLGGTTEDGLNGLEVIRQAGGKALVIRPDACIYRHTSEAALAAGVADEAVSEHELWARIEAFGRQLSLEAAGTNTETPRIERLAVKNARCGDGRSSY